MRKLGFAAITATLLLMLSPLVCTAEEELFDTQEAGRHIDQGLTLSHAKNYDAAIKELEQAIEIAPEAEAYYYLGYAYYLKGRNGDVENKALSRENFQKAYDINPNFTPTRVKPVDLPAPMGGNQPAAASGATGTAKP